MEASPGVETSPDSLAALQPLTLSRALSKELCLERRLGGVASAETRLSDAVRLIRCSLSATRSSASAASASRAADSASSHCSSPATQRSKSACLTRVCARQACTCRDAKGVHILRRTCRRHLCTQQTLCLLWDGKRGEGRAATEGEGWQARGGACSRRRRGRASEVGGMQPQKARDGKRGEGHAATEGEGWQAR